MGKINVAWHMAHKMPKNPTHAQRMNWHVAHLKKCACRMPDAKLKWEMAQFKAK